MLAAPVLSYMQGVVSGKLPYMLPSSPFIPGSDLIGIVDHVGSEVFNLEPGTLVHARPQIFSRGHFSGKDDILIGLTGMSPESPRIQEIWPDGAFAEFAHYPVECVTPLDALSSIEPERLGALMHLAVGYGGLLAADLKAGESVIIGGATGNIGAHTVLVALAMGASRIIPVGRKIQVLESLKALAPDRVRPAVISEDAERDQASIADASGGSADCYLDITGGGDTGSVLSAIRCLKPGGRVALMGALQDAIQIPYAEIMVRGLTIKGNYYVSARRTCKAT
jgi:alcohol dehydrogenase